MATAKRAISHQAALQRPAAVFVRIGAIAEHKVRISHSGKVPKSSEEDKFRRSGQVVCVSLAQRFADARLSFSARTASA